MPTGTHPDWETDVTYVRNIQGVESTGSTGYKDAHLMPGEMFFCGVVTEAFLGPLGNYKKDEYVSKVTNAYHSVTVAVHELESLNRVIRSAERSLGSLLNLEDTLRPLTTEQGTLRVRSKVVRKSRAAKVQKLEDVVVPRGYKLQPCFTTLGVDGKEVESGAISPGDVVQVRVKMRAYQMEDSAGVYLQPVYIRKMKTLGAAEFAEVENSTGNTAATVVAPSYSDYEF
ncbi:hypothetical protein MP228_001877 [Amoeboaphelidium protococcarum]|nr:hypothetical protein MP228_001877 [Amoeboaphelidium protococcarum]